MPCCWRCTTPGRGCSRFRTGALATWNWTVRVALLRGKGGKRRLCPLWQETGAVLRDILRTGGVDPADRQPLFRNRAGAEVDLESKRKAVRTAKPLLNTDPDSADRRTRADTLSWLESL